MLCAGQTLQHGLGPKGSGQGMDLLVDGPTHQLNDYITSQNLHNCQCFLHKISKHVLIIFLHSIIAIIEQGKSAGKSTLSFLKKYPGAEAQGSEIMDGLRWEFQQGKGIGPLHAL